jgi:cytosine/adenosine deaminase-related metal-dependent hydrolase
VRTLLSGGTVVSVDPAVGDLDRGDVLIQDGVIVHVAERIDAHPCGDDAPLLGLAGGGLTVTWFVRQGITFIRAGFRSRRCWLRLRHGG